MEVESLLRRASAAPLGPLALSFSAAGPDAWTLTVRLGDKVREVRAERDLATEGLLLACRVDSEPSVSLDGHWVSDTKRDQISGQMERRLWLHGDGLTPALLLNALASLVPVAVAMPGNTDGIIVEPARIVIPPPPLKESKPVPVERPKATGWNSFDFGRRETPEPKVENAISPTAEPEIEPAPAAAPDLSHAPEPGDDGEMVAQTETEAAGAIMEPEPEPIADTTPQLEEEEPVEAVQPARSAGYCRECGSPYRPDHDFCTNCGAKLH